MIGGESNALEILCRGAIDVIEKNDLASRLADSQKDKRPLLIKAGFDPSAPDIHLGHTVILRKLRQFQDLGHKIILIIGDYTAMIGDPTGKAQTRPALTRGEVQKNAETYQSQAFKILDKDPAKIEVRFNGEWLGKYLLSDFLEQVAARYTVARTLERDDFEKRMAENQAITIREFIYPLLQGYDSVVVKADVELGGSDQKFNLLVGRNLQRAFSQTPQVVMTFPLLVGLDGTQKMSKSLGNYVAVNDAAKDMFGKLMSIPDSLMQMYYDLLTQTSGKEIQRQIEAGMLHPKEAKKSLAVEITAFYHGRASAEREAEEFERIFRDKQNPEKPQELIIQNDKIGIADLLKQTTVVTSTSSAYRLIEQGAVTLDGKKITDPKAIVRVKEGSLLKAGKKSFFKLIVKKV